MDVQGRLLHPPKTITLSFDYLCNLSCVTCRKPRKGGYFSNPFSQQILQQILAAKIPHLKINGAGEFSVNPVFMDFLGSLTPENAPHLKSITLLTNGIALTPECYSRFSSHCRTLIKAIQVSLDAANDSTYVKVRKSSSFHKILENLRFINALPQKPEVRINMVVQRHNVHEIGDFVQLAVQEKLYGVLFMHVEDWHSMDPAVLASEYMLTADEREKARKSIHCLQEKYQGRTIILSDI